MKFIKESILIFLIVSFVWGSCSEEQNPSLPQDPRVIKRDSLLAIYGDQMDIKEPAYLEVYAHGVAELTYLYGKAEGKFWLGLFESPEKKIKEYILDLDPEASIHDIYFYPVGISILVSGFELTEVHGYDPSDLSQDALISKSILRIYLDDFALKSATSYLHRKELTFMDFARRWTGGFLLEHSGIVSEFGKNTTQYLSTDLSESIVWDCQTPGFPAAGVIHLKVDFYLTLGENSVGGFDYSTCKSWTKNILDFYGVTTCPGCVTSIKLLNQIDDTIAVEVTLNEEVRKVVLVYRTGEVLSNEKI